MGTCVEGVVAVYDVDGGIYGEEDGPGGCLGEFWEPIHA